MNMGWLIIYWPGTKCVMSVGDADEDTPIPDGGVFMPMNDGPPPSIEDRPKSQDDIENEKRLELNVLMQEAEGQKSAISIRIGVLNDAVKYAMATPEEVDELKLRISQQEDWGKYAVLLGRTTSQSEWYDSANWPAPPSERI